MTTPPRRREVWLVDFEPAIGSEIRKARPAVVINEDEVGRPPPRFVPVPSTAGNGLRKTSSANTIQIKSISLDRFRRKLGVISEDHADEIAEAIANGVGAP